MHLTKRRTARLALLGAVLFSATPIGADDGKQPPPYSVAPTAVINGPDTTDPGDMVILDASMSQATGFLWLLADSDKSFLEVENGRKVVFATGAAGRYTFVLISANASADGKPAVAIAKHVLTVGEPGPTPVPPGPNPVPPGPNPNPPDPFPPGKYGLSRFAFDAAAAVPLDAGTRQRTATALAGSFDAIASVIAAGAIKTPDEAIRATSASNITALGQSRDAWRPFATALQTKLNALSKGGQLVAMDDHIVAWREISLGLRSVK